MKLLYVVRDGEVRFRLPVSNIEIKPDGTIWAAGIPLLGCTDPADKAAAVAAVRCRAWAELRDEWYTRLGDNPNGLWAGWDADWDAHPAKVAADAAVLAGVEARKAVERVQVEIYLSSRGWGDYSGVAWRGDITRPDTEIIAECQALLAAGTDVDTPNQSDAQLLVRISIARATWQVRQDAAKLPPRPRHGPGYCYNCETYCDGDCGDFAPVETARHAMRAMRDSLDDDFVGD